MKDTFRAIHCPLPSSFLFLGPVSQTKTLPSFGIVLLGLPLGVKSLWHRYLLIPHLPYSTLCTETRGMSAALGYLISPLVLLDSYALDTHSPVKGMRWVPTFQTTPPSEGRLLQHLLSRGRARVKYSIHYALRDGKFFLSRA